MPTIKSGFESEPVKARFAAAAAGAAVAGMVGATEPVVGEVGALVTVVGVLAFVVEVLGEIVVGVVEAGT